MRLLHTMLRVGNLERSLAFYQDVLDMQLLRKQDYPEGRFTLAFIGYGDEANHTVIELTHNWDTEQYDLGSGFGHIAIEVDDEHVKNFVDGIVEAFTPPTLVDLAKTHSKSVSNIDNFSYFLNKIS